MLSWFRASASRIATVVVVSLAALGTSAVGSHGDDSHDSACVAASVEHDAAAHRFTSPQSPDPSQPDHCLVCHWVRSFRPRTEARVVFGRGVQTVAVRQVEGVTTLAIGRIAQPPLRAPPISPNV